MKMRELLTRPFPASDRPAVDSRDADSLAQRAGDFINSNPSGVPTWKVAEAVNCSINDFHKHIAPALLTRGFHTAPGAITTTTTPAPTIISSAALAASRITSASSTNEVADLRIEQELLIRASGGKMSRRDAMAAVVAKHPELQTAALAQANTVKPQARQRSAAAGDRWKALVAANGGDAIKADRLNPGSRQAYVDEVNGR